jgi:hypothetical protein
MYGQKNNKFSRRTLVPWSIYLLGWLDQEMFQHLGQVNSRDSAANSDKAVIFVINR